MRARLTALLLVTTLLGTLTACATPQVSVRKANLDKINTKGLLVGIDLSVFNPNQYAVPLTGIGWGLDIYRERLASGSTAFNRNLAASSRTPVPMKLPVSFRKVTSSVQRVLQGKPIDWQFGGTAGFKTPVGVVNVDFTEQGTWQNPFKGGKFNIGGFTIGQNTPPSSSAPPRISIDLIPPSVGS